MGVLAASCGGGDSDFGRPLREGPAQDLLDQVVLALEGAESYEVAIQAEQPITTLDIEYVSPGAYRISDRSALDQPNETIWTPDGGFYIRDCDESFEKCGSWQGGPGNPEYWDNESPPTVTQIDWLLYPNSASALIRHLEGVTSGQTRAPGGLVLTGTVNPTIAQRSLTPPTPTNAPDTPFDQASVEYYDEEPVDVELVVNEDTLLPRSITLRGDAAGVFAPRGTILTAEVHFSRYGEVSIVVPTAEDLEDLRLIGISDQGLAAQGIRLERPGDDATSGEGDWASVGLANNKLRQTGEAREVVLVELFAPERGVLDGTLVWAVNFIPESVRAVVSPTIAADYAPPRYMLAFVEVDTNIFLFAVSEQ